MNPINTYNTGEPQAPGRMNLVGQRKPEHLIDLAAAVVSLEETAKYTAERFDNRPGEATLHQLIEAEKAAQDAEAIYLAELADWYADHEWARENAQEQQAEYFTEA